MAGEAETAGRTRTAPAAGLDPRVTTLRAAVHRLRRELGGYRVALADREVAMERLSRLDELSLAGVPDVETLRQALLEIAAALGSVSALAPAVAEFRRALELFGVPRFPPEEPRWGAAPGAWPKATY
ncbi:DUF5955 family protein [Streptomyces sedi]|uniref:Uncharacterized protein n=1 Tax=Streptomyces sedi TaxID=555059 RepID=A0A5C4V763_9ACTN|nr:DUF5955 family protein [Streptomyces sedi]TNM31633.1 hypothetical protein FH715_08740 [Streptomyces sedi]